MTLVFFIPRGLTGEIPSSLCSSVLLASRSQNFDRLRMTSMQPAADDIQGLRLDFARFSLAKRG
ncbi:MAG: hypothetical protein IJE25_01400 [Clostridia bacterium]|nr:hypothetical protein [Clostridia bacterium]